MSANTKACRDLEGNDGVCMFLLDVCASTPILPLVLYGRLEADPTLLLLRGPMAS